MASGAFWAVARRLVLLALVAHVAFLVLFVTIGIWSLSILNAAGVLLYAIAYQLLRWRINRIALTLVWLELSVHAAAASLYVGWNSGFHHYLLLLVPLVMVSGGRWRLYLLAGLWLFYFGLYWLCQQIDPLDLRGFAFQTWLQAFNTVILFGITSHVIGHYYLHLRNSERRLVDLATRDALTGLFNRRHVLDTAALGVAWARDAGLPTALVLADIDHFKQVNDNHGHAAGDRVLAHIGARLAELTHAQDIVGRWGGEEFLIVLPGTGASAACDTAERVRRVCGTDVVRIGASSLSVTLSFGVAEMRAHEDLAETLARADVALYRSKTDGRDRVTLGH